jgi:endonuclease-3 related protein
VTVAETALAADQMAPEEERSFLLETFRRLRERYDLDRWHWQASTPAVDVCVGAVLVQHTAWTNVEKAVANLRAAGALSIEAMAGMDDETLAALVRPAGFPLTKARRLKAFASLALRHGGLDLLLGLPTPELRAALLSTEGIGPETADVVLLYAARRPANVPDAYTQRLLRRLGLGPARDGYAAWAAWLANRLPPDLGLLQRFHAGVVVHCKETCRARPRCAACPLLDMCAFGRASAPGSKGPIS